jgi:hypothetical protein
MHLWFLYLFYPVYFFSTFSPFFCSQVQAVNQYLLDLPAWHSSSENFLSHMPTIELPQLEQKTQPSLLVSSKIDEFGTEEPILK